MWAVEYTDEFGEWFECLTESEQDSIDRNVHLLEQFGPALPDRYSKPIVTSRLSHMRDVPIADALYEQHPRELADEDR
jgi:hypothetical protein